MNTRHCVAISVLWCLGAFACGSPKDASPAGASAAANAAAPAGAPATKADAQAALKASQVAFAAVRPAAEQLLQPEAQRQIRPELAGIEIMQEAAQKSIDQGDYPFALDQIGLANRRIAALGPAIAAVKADPVETEWASVKSMVPSMMASLESRATEVANSKTLPAGVTRDMVKAAQNGLAAVKVEWTKVLADGAAGNREAATKKGKELQTRLGMLLVPLK